MSAEIISGKEIAAEIRGETGMIEMFKEKDIGVVAGRPVPVCDTLNITFRVIKAMWDVHHLMVMQERAINISV